MNIIKRKHGCKLLPCHRKDNAKLCFLNENIILPIAACRGLFVFLFDYIFFRQWSVFVFSGVVAFVIVGAVVA